MIDRVGPALRLLREEAGLSQRELALRCREQAARAGGSGRVTQTMVSQWERGEQLPTLASLWAVLDAQGYQLEQLGWALASVAPAGQVTGDPSAEPARRALELRQFRQHRAQASLAPQVKGLRRALGTFEKETVSRFEIHEKRLRALETSSEG